MTRASSKHHFKGISIPPKNQVVSPFKKTNKVKLWQRKILMISESPGFPKERFAALPRSRRYGGVRISELASPLLMFIVLGQMSWRAGLPPVGKTPKFNRLVT